jgi:hypothetical protein
MKKHLLFIFITLFAVQSWGQTLIPNQTSFLVSTSGPMPSTPSSILDNNINTPTKSFTYSQINITCSGGSSATLQYTYSHCCFNTGSNFIFDLTKSHNISSIVFSNFSPESTTSINNCTGSQFGGYNPTNVSYRIYSGSTILGPWTIIKDTTLNVTNTINITNYINKTFRFFKLEIYQSDRSIIFGEINLYENNLITANSSTILQNGNCVTLTSAAIGETYQWSTGETTQSINVCNSGTYTVNVTNTSFTGNQDHSASIAVSKLGSQDNLPGPNGEVYAIYKNGNNVYVGGDFNAFGPITGSGAQIDSSNSNANTALPRVDGAINTAISDGNGGWYIGGVFTRVGSYVINNLAHIKGDNTIDTIFKPEPNGAVNTLALYGSSLYLGGSFTTVKTLANNYAAKIDAATGDPNLWNVNVNGIVRSIQLYADQIIFGGNFTSLGGASRNYLGAVDTVYIQATTWNPNANAAVYKVYVNGSKLYAGGDFTTIGGVSKQYGCGFTLPAFTTDGYNMGANGRINDFVLNGSVLYAAGSFTIIGGASRNYIAAMNYLNALTNSFNATADGVVNTLAIAGGNLIAGGAFSNIGGAARNRLAALNLTTGTAAGWNPNVVGLKGTTSTVSCLATQGTNIYAGGSFYSVGASVRNNLAAIDATTGQLTAWNPNVNNIVRALYADNNYVYLGGDFTTVNSSITKNRIAQISASTAIATGWNPNADNTVYALTVKGTTLFAGGSFANIGGAARVKIAALSTTSGAATAFNPTANGNVNALCIGGDTLYLGGVFTTIGGQSRNRIASYNISGNSLTTLNPNVDNTVNTLSFSNNKLYLGGNFVNVSSIARVNIAEFDVLTNTLSSLNPGATTTTGVNAIFSKDSSLYLGGGYNFPNQGNPINNLGSINTSGAYVGYWQPQPDNIIRTIFASDNKVYVGGSFKNITSRYQPYFASTDIFINAPMATITNITPTSLCANNPITLTGNNFRGISSVKIGGNTVPYTVLSIDTIIITPASSMTGTISITNPLGTVTSTQSVNVISSPGAPTIGTITQPSCTVVTGSVVLNGLQSTGSWTINPGSISGSGTTQTISNLAAGTYNFTVSTSTCTSPASIVVINAQPVFPSAPIVGTITQPTCSSLGSVILNGLPATGSWTINPGNIIGSGTSTTISNLAAATYNYTVTNASSCTSVASANVVINNQPSTPTAPIVGTITQPSCTVATGSVVLNGLPSTGSWTINPGNISGSGTNTTISSLTTGTYNYTVTNASSCTSVASANIVINSISTTPTAPTLGGLYAPTCTLATGGFLLEGLPSTGSWTINPGNITGTGTSTTISGLNPGTYNYSVTNSSFCTSPLSSNLIMPIQPETPNLQIVTISQPICSTSTGSVALSGLPSGSWWLNKNGSFIVAGSGTTYTVNLNPGGPYYFTVSNGYCTSPATTNVVINAQPTTPTAPIVGSIAHPSCNSPTGFVYLSGLPASGTWTINPGNISGSGTTTAVTNLLSGTYNFTVTNASNCSSNASANVVINAQPPTPAMPVIGAITHPSCSVSTGSVELTGLPATGNWTLYPGVQGLVLTGSGTSAIFSNLPSQNSLTFTVYNSYLCMSVNTAYVLLNAQPPTPSVPTVGTITQPNCTVATGSVILNGLPATGSWTINPGNITGTGTSKTITGLVAGTYNYTVINASTCTSVASANIVINTQPVTPTAPTLGTITQPTCTLATGSVILNDLPATGTWTINPGNITGSGITKTITGLASGTYNFTVTNVISCTSVATANVVINTQPVPNAPIVGTITQPSCTVATGSVILNGLPATGSWTINPGNITGIGITKTITGIVSGTYNYTVTNVLSCTSVATANVVINTQPIPTAPTVGTITQPSCTVATGSVILNGLPATGSWTINPGNITGTGISKTITGINSGTYNYTVTNASTCTSVESANVVINTQPIPTAPIIVTIIQPSCTVATGSVVLNGLPETGNWTLNPYDITGTGTSKTITGFPAGTYYFTVTNASGCTSVALSNVVINTQPVKPTAPIVGTKTQPTCALATGSVILNALPVTGTWTINPGNISGTGYSKTLTGLIAGTYNYTVTNASGCTSVASANVVINTQPVTPTAPTVGTITQPNCTVSTGSVILNGLPATGTWTINPGNTNGSGTTTTISSLVAGTYNYTVTNASACTSVASANVVINSQPATPTAPTIGTITQTTCASSTGSIILNDLPATGTWTINPGNISGTGISKTLTGLIAGTYNYTVTNASACTSVASANVLINTQPATPTAPTIGTITQTTCASSTGSVILNGLPATGTWTINPGNISGTGISKTITGLIAGTYNYTVTNASACTSVASANVVINTQPMTPTAPTVGIITQTTCASSTGSAILNGLPATGTWTINPGNISGSGITTTISNLAAGTYNYTVTNASACTSVASANVVINSQPTTPTAPTVGIITQTTCASSTGSAVLNGLPATGTWIINPGNISGSGTSKTLTSLIAGTYNYTVTNASACTSVASANVVINSQPTTPTALTIGIITQTTCASSTGSAVLNGLPATGTWTINPGNISGSGTSKTLTGLIAGTYNYTVTNATSCTSAASANVVINTQPTTPTAPNVGPITQTTCASSTGSAVLNGLPATGTWIINPGNISGTGTTTTISSLVAGTYNYTVTNATGCTSVASANVVINTQPVTPLAAGTISGLSIVCQGQNNVVYKVPTIANTTSYTWTFPTGASGTSTIDSLIISYGTSAVSGNVTVKGNNACGSGAVSTKAITVNPLPVVVNQTASITSGSVFTVAPAGVPAGTTYTWATPVYTAGVSGGSAQTIGQTNISQTLTISSGSGTANYTVTPTSGNCSGNTFTVTVSVNQLVSCPPPWIPVQNQQYNMNVIAKLYLSNVLTTNNADAIGAFVGNECRGIAYPDSSLNGISFLTISSNVQSGESVTFKAWRSQLCDECPVSETIPFVNQTEIGTMATPFEFHCGLVELCNNFGAGYNWFSVNVNPGSMSLNSLFNNLTPCENDRIIGQQSFATYYGSQWVGSLTTIDPKAMYKLKLCSQQTWCKQGLPVTNQPITVASGYPWIGYLPQTNLAINTALSGISPSPISNDRFNAQSSFATYSGSQWIGSLTTLQKGKGYIIHLASPSVLTYPATSSKSAIIIEDNLTKALSTSDNVKTNARYNMQIVADILLPNGIISNNSADKVYAYVGNECRGISSPLTGLNGRLFLTVGSDIEQGEDIHFKVYISGLNQVFDVNSNLIFASEMETGTMGNPYHFDLTGGSVGISLNNNENGISFGDIYPNPFDKTASLDFNIYYTGKVEGKIINGLGIEVQTIVSKDYKAGSYILKIDGETLSPGIYTLLITYSNKENSTVITRKMIIK